MKAVKYVLFVVIGSICFVILCSGCTSNTGPIMPREFADINDDYPVGLVFVGEMETENGVRLYFQDKNTGEITTRDIYLASNDEAGSIEIFED